MVVLENPSLGVSVVVSDCSAGVGDVVSATFNVPAMEINGYYDRIQCKASSSRALEALPFFFDVKSMHEYALISLKINNQS